MLYWLCIQPATTQTCYCKLVNDQNIATAPTKTKAITRNFARKIAKIGQILVREETRKKLSTFRLSLRNETKQFGMNEKVKFLSSSMNSEFLLGSNTYANRENMKILLSINDDT